MSKQIFISGATGNVGYQVATQLLKNGFSVRVGVRSNSQSRDLEALGAQLVNMDFNDRISIENALQGTGKAFSITPLVPDLIDLGINFVEAAKTAGVKHIVRSSGMGADNPHAITLGQWHRTVEKAIEASGVAYTFLRPNSFMQNFINHAGESIRTHGAFYFPQGDSRVSLVDVRDVAAAAVAALTENGHEGKAYDLTGPQALSNEEIATILSRVTGRKISYVDVAEETAKKTMLQMGMPESIVTALLELYAINKAGYTAAVSPAVEELTGRRPLNFENFATDYKSFFI